MSDFWSQSWVWILVCVVGFGLCAFLPGRFEDERMRKIVSWFVLIPISLILILYAYPVGIEVFKRWGLTG